VPNPFHIVTSRNEFFNKLDIAISKTRTHIQHEPNWELLGSISRQLDAIKAWTKNDRKPTFDERKSITMGRMAGRELQDTTDYEWYDYKELIGELAYYFKLWLSDAGLNAVDDDDMGINFPDTYDVSDE
jgi:hypothetical protein